MKNITIKVFIAVISFMMFASCKTSKELNNSTSASVPKDPRVPFTDTFALNHTIIAQDIADSKFQFYSGDSLSFVPVETGKPVYKNGDVLVQDETVKVLKFSLGHAIAAADDMSWIRITYIGSEDASVLYALKRDEYVPSDSFLYNDRMYKLVNGQDAKLLFKVDSLNKIITSPGTAYNEELKSTKPIDNTGTNNSSGNSSNSGNLDGVYYNPHKQNQQNQSNNTNNNSTVVNTPIQPMYPVYVVHSGQPDMYYYYIDKYKTRHLFIVDKRGKRYFFSFDGTGKRIYR